MRACQCPNCKAHISYDDSREFGFCQYCGSKIMLDDYRSTHRVIDTARMHETETERIIRLRELELKEKEKERKQTFKITICIIACAITLVFIILGIKLLENGEEQGFVGFCLIIGGITTVSITFSSAFHDKK